MFVIMFLEHLIVGWSQTSYEGRRYNEQERFFNLCSSNYYLPFNIIAFYSFNIKEIHLAHPMI